MLGFGIRGALVERSRLMVETSGLNVQRTRMKHVVAGGLASLTLHSAAALELQVGSRIPTRPSERIVVMNDGGIRNATHTFGFGGVCSINRWLKSWLVVRRIVGDHVLLELECYPAVFDDSCPNGTETSRPAAEMRARLNADANQRDLEFMKGLQRQVPRTREEPSIKR
jgi:hypothetical protein